MKFGKRAGKPWAVALMAFFCFGWIQPGALFFCPSSEECAMRAASPEQDPHALHAALEMASGPESAPSSSCPDGDEHGQTRACCQPSPAILSLEQAPVPSCQSFQAPVRGAAFFASPRSDRLFRPPQVLL